MYLPQVKPPRILCRWVYLLQVEPPTFFKNKNANLISVGSFTYSTVLTSASPHVSTRPMPCVVFTLWYFSDLGKYGRRYCFIVVCLVAAGQGDGHADLLAAAVPRVFLLTPRMLTHSSLRIKNKIKVKNFQFKKIYINLISFLAEYECTQKSLQKQHRFHMG